METRVYFIYGSYRVLVLEIIIKQFKEYFNPRKNITYSWFKFVTYRQEIGQSFDDYMTEIRNLGSDCELEGLQELFLRDMVIIGLNDIKCKNVYLENLILT